MTFSINVSASSKHDAMRKLESAERLPAEVRAFISKALDGFSEVGGNHPLIHSDDPALAEHKAKGGLAVNPVAIRIEASGHIDPEGGESTCSIKVAKG